jgi:hypothetical protein
MPIFSQRVLRCICLAAVLCGLPAAALGGVILNTLEGYDPAEPGWSGNLDALFSASGGNTEKVLFESGGRVQWRDERDRLRLQANAGYEESGGVETARNIVVHLRHNRRLGGPWATVSFVQVQRNPFQGIGSRWLAGAGPRYDLVRDEQGLVGIGTTPMLEIERLENETGRTTRGRLSVFLHVARKFGAATRIDAVAFWQPLFNDVSAARASGNLACTVDLVGELDLKVGFAVEHNARAPLGVEKTDWSTFTGLGLTL